MSRATPYLRFPLSAICGVIGGWLGLLVIIGIAIYSAATAPPLTTFDKDSLSQNGKTADTMETMKKNWNTDDKSRR